MHKKEVCIDQRWILKSPKGDFVFICKHAESIKNVFQAKYRLPGFKIIIIRIFNKYTFAKRISMKSWRYLSNHNWKGAERSLFHIFQAQSKGKSEQIKKDFLSCSGVQIK